MKRLLPILVVGVVVALAGLLFYQFAAPRLEAAEPLDGSVDVPAGAFLRLVFSCQMEPESVLEHLTFTPQVPGEITWEGQTLVFVPASGWPGGRKVQVNLAPGARSQGLLSLSMREDYTGTFEVSRPRLVYLYPADGAANLYAIQPDSGRNRGFDDLLGGIWISMPVLLKMRFITACATPREAATFIASIYTHNQQKQAVGCCLQHGWWPAYSRNAQCPQYHPPGITWHLKRPPHWSMGDWATPRSGWFTWNPDGLRKNHSSWEIHFTRCSSRPGPQMGSWSSHNSTLSSLVFYDTGQQIVAEFTNDLGEVGSWAPGGQAYAAPDFIFMNGELPGGTGEVVRLSTAVCTCTHSPLRIIKTLVGRKMLKICCRHFHRMGRCWLLPGVTWISHAGHRDGRSGCCPSSQMEPPGRHFR